MVNHVFGQTGRPVTLEARLETEPRIMEGVPACPVCGTVVDLEAIEHSIRSKSLAARQGEAPSYLLLCALPCFLDGCPVYLRLEVKLSEEEFLVWRQNPNCRFDHTHFRDGRPVSLEAQATETASGEPPYHCPVCYKVVDLVALVPLSKVLISGMPLPRPNSPPQHRATAYVSCPHCTAHLTCSCFVSAEELEALMAGPQPPPEPPQ